MPWMILQERYTTILSYVRFPVILPKRSMFENYEFCVFPTKGNFLTSKKTCFVYNPNMLFFQATWQTQPTSYRKVPCLNTSAVRITSLRSSSMAPSPPFWEPEVARGCIWRDTCAATNCFWPHNTHAWYRRKFEDFPESQKRLIPFLF